ncbi:MAG: hypothetical protein AYK18_17210 [Theionarchaea archaeon DG-70]|nr:MAG: hypothetical protein AYK18_17210 [Theionarchaea archaeon DG-70]
MRNNLPILSSIAALIFSFRIVSHISTTGTLPLIIPESLIVTIRPEQVPRYTMLLAATLIFVKFVSNSLIFHRNVKEMLILLGFNCTLSALLLQIGDGKIFSFPGYSWNLDYYFHSFHIGLLLSVWGVLFAQIDQINIPMPSINLFSHQAPSEEQSRNVNREIEIQNRGDSLQKQAQENIEKEESKTEQRKERPKSRWQIVLENIKEMEEDS